MEGSIESSNAECCLAICATATRISWFPASSSAAVSSSASGVNFNNYTSYINFSSYTSRLEASICTCGFKTIYSFTSRRQTFTCTSCVQPASLLIRLKANNSNTSCLKATCFVCSLDSSSYSSCADDFSSTSRSDSSLLEANSTNSSNLEINNSYASRVSACSDANHGFSPSRLETSNHGTTNCVKGSSV